MKLKTRIKDKLIGEAVRYCSDGLYRLSGANLVASEMTSAVKLLIVAKHHYIERSISLPITIKKDVKAAVAFELESLKTEFQVFYKIGVPENGKTQVMIWQVPHSVMPKGVLLAIPETYLLSSQLAPEQVLSYIGVGGRRTLVAKNGSQLYSSTNQSLNVSVFGQMIGINAVQTIDVSEEMLAERLEAGLLANWQHLLQGFWLKSLAPKVDWQQVIKPYLIPTGICLVAYLGLTSLYVSYQHSVAKNLIAEQRGEINEALDIQNEINALTEELLLLDNPGDVAPPLWRVWQVLAPVFQKQVIFKFIRYNDSNLYFRGEAESATEILELLLNNPLVKEPTFTAAVKKLSDKESFTIKFSFTPLSEIGAEFRTLSQPSDVVDLVADEQVVKQGANDAR